MAYTVVVTKRAKKDIDALEPLLKKRLGKKLLQISALDDLHLLVRQLVNREIGDYRIRVGDYRVLCDIEGDNLIILRIQYRKDVYR